MKHIVTVWFLILVLVTMTAIAMYKLGYVDGKQSVKQPKQLAAYKGFNVDDTKVQVIVDDQTNCRYAVFNNKSVVPIYNGLGQVEGCGE